jgi:hypothetical protein
MVRGVRHCHAQAHDAGERQGTQSAASYGHPKYRERATYAHDLERCEPPDDMRGSRSGLGCGVRSQGIHGSLAGHITVVKKISAA